MLRLQPFHNTRALNSSLAETVVKNVCIVGSGLMGSGIAQVVAQASFMVTLVDLTETALEKSRNNIWSSLKQIAKKQHKEDEKAQASMIENTMRNITLTTNLKEGAEKADLVIEAIVENLQAKQKLFAEVDAFIKRSTLLATNTSSLRVQDIGRSLRNKSNFGGLHFFNPVPMMRLCEVVRTIDTSDATFNAFEAFGKAIGKTTVACKDTPGFIVNRLLIPYLLEAIRMNERGDASLRDIDIAMKLGASYPMGPFELLDYVGLDTARFIQDGWHESFPEEKLFQPCEMLKNLVNEGKLGRKSGEGFYTYKQ